jgi:hypothetical protein
MGNYETVIGTVTRLFDISGSAFPHPVADADIVPDEVDLNVTCNIFPCPFPK